MTLRKERAAKGLCPECGAEAAPYYLCGECHALRYVSKIMSQLEREGFVRITRDPRDRRRRRYFLEGKEGPPPDKGTGSSRGLGYGERGKPRLRGVPVDVEAELSGIFERAGRPLTIEEVREAWVRLRPKPGRTAADGMAAIISAEDKRAKRRARNAKLTARQAG